MVHAYVLICCDLASSDKVVEELGKIEGVEEVSPVSGVYDIVVRISASRRSNKRYIWMLENEQSINDNNTNCF